MKHFDLPYSAIYKGLFMTFALTILSEKNHGFIGILGLFVLFLKPRYNWKFYAFFALFWPVMEIVILHHANGNTWTYKHEDIYNVPIWIFPLWAIVSECVIDIFEWGQRINWW